VEPTVPGESTLIGRDRPRGWVRRTRDTAWFASDEPAVPIVALAGFLVRGGILVVALPSVVLPSLLGLASTFGVNALGIDGRPTSWLVATIAIASVVAAALLAIALLVGSIVDVWLIHAAMSRDPLVLDEQQTLPDRWLVTGMAAMRAVCLLPLGGTVALAAPGIYTAVYDELTLPTNLADPLLLRVAQVAWPQLVLVAVAWLVTETVSAIAVRRMVLGDDFLDSLGGAISQLIRAPISSLLTMVVTTAVSLAALVLAALATAVSFGLVLDAARLPGEPTIRLFIGGLDASRAVAPVAFVSMAFILALAWFGSLGTAGVTSAWRSAAWTEETALARFRERAERSLVLPAEAGASPEAR
jgi:hypothetical protein